MPTHTTAVRMFHRGGVSRDYAGSHAGSTTSWTSQEYGAEQATNQEGVPIQLTCPVDGCGVRFTFRLTTDKERKQNFRHSLKRALMLLGIALAIALSGALLMQLSATSHIAALKVVAIVLIAGGWLTALLVTPVLVNMGRRPRYEFTSENSDWLRPRVQHGVELL